ncbi:MAG: DoxX family protein [Bdellovibrionota bacterium]
MSIRSIFQVQPTGTKVSLVVLMVRFVAGLAFVMHGFPKIQNPMGWMGPEATVPGVFQFLAALSEFIGGMFWMVGLLTPLASVGIFCTMSVAIYFHAMVHGDPFVGRGASYELALVYLTISMLLYTFGPGKFSADRILFKS